MTRFVAFALLTLLASSASLAAVIPPRANPPFPDFPDLIRAEHAFGFANVDLDGVYRSYHANGTVLDAARLSGEQIDSFLNFVEGHVDAERLAQDRAHFANVDSATVPEEQLLQPLPEVIPHAKLEAKYEQVKDLLNTRSTSFRQDDKRQLTCSVILYCVWENPCPTYGCWCNGAICT